MVQGLLPCGLSSGIPERASVGSDVGRFLPRVAFVFSVHPFVFSISAVFFVTLFW